MHLWTWQSRDFSLANSDKKVDSIQYSHFLHEEKKIDPREANQHEKAYQQVFSLVDSNQLIWCYKDYEEATSAPNEWEKYNRVLWELDVPEEKIHWYCPVAWEKLRSGKVEKCGCVWGIHYFLRTCDEGEAKMFEIQFNSYWEAKTNGELLNSIILRRSSLNLKARLGDPVISECPEPIVIHPICGGGGKILKNPLDPAIGKWWKSKTRRPPKGAHSVMPCQSCQAMNHT